MPLSKKLQKLRAVMKYGGGLQGKAQMAVLFCKHAGLLRYEGASTLLQIPTNVRNAPLLHLRDTGPDSILFSEILAEHDYAALHQLDFEPETIFDIGANIGIGSFYLRSVFQNARIWGFEPAPSERAVLERNYANWGNATALSYALADHNQENVQFAVHADKTGGQHLVHLNADDETASNVSAEVWHHISVNMRRMDQILKDHNLPIPDLVKIDIEGAELVALEGFGEAISQPRAYILETHSQKLHQDCIDKLSSAGYRVLSDLPRSRDTHILLMSR